MGVVSRRAAAILLVRAGLKDASYALFPRYVQETIDSKDPFYYQFLLIFEKFKLQEPEKPKTDAAPATDPAAIAQRLLERKKPADLDEKDDDDVSGLIG